MSRYRIGITSVGGRPCVFELQLKPCSSMHCDEQPSRLWTLPSSHCSCGNLRPSPHTAVQVPWLQTGSTVQVGEQPSYGMRLLSSHCSRPSGAPSPQTV